MGTTFGPDPIAVEIDAALEHLDAGHRVPECKYLDFKEDSSRRGKHGELLLGRREDERAAEQLAGEAACMANTPGGGALIVGVNDKDDGPLLIGTSLDTEWLRRKIYEHTSRALTVDVREVHVHDARLLIVRSPTALEPIKVKGKIRWRIGDHCEEIDATSWHHRHQYSIRYDWSAQFSNVSLEEVRPAALDAARAFLQASTDEAAVELANCTSRELLSRLNAIDGEGKLTNAAALVFVGRPEPCLDYIRRDMPGQDSGDRVRIGGVSLLEQLQRVFAVARAYNPLSHVSSGLVEGQVRQLPERAIREAIVNGLAHREWGLPDATLIEHNGAVLRVTSPGGFFGGVTAENIITHPSTSRNVALTELLASLRIAEREGIGVDRMVGDLLRRGLRMPTIREIDGPYVVTTLSGVDPDVAWTSWLTGMDVPELMQNLRTLMVMRFLTDHLWIDEDILAPYLQVPVEEVHETLELLRQTECDGEPLLKPIRGVPDEALPAFTLSKRANKQLDMEYANRGLKRSVPSRAVTARQYARHRGRISTTELGVILDVWASNVGQVLKDLMADGVLQPSSEAMAGRGFHYLWTGDEAS
ncbi:ATP-binding protein [Cutibacterium avidum]|uniref:RNA-binding domain-containing protein n=1 Tax=Cutibacterium avidum TaxID=33010 RepID=UPI00080FFCE6|nr:ATP-binding protein [Cutibacterium avidum]MBS5745621.1 putative DNA binding domain-containing protein [Propionibacterium sp.]MDU7815776.1 ATP-binding protein [Bacillota bacterium]MDK7358248.1 ATP-binding protein [Cutibacterium avidum]MDK7372018.1 ATP-binding protein [Cutibacterium avidum]MDU3220175.1 ATP-binding protein [Cutibacterium avidum]